MAEPTTGPLTFRHVLLPLDGSAFALAALPTARALAERFGAELWAMAVVADDGDVERVRRELEAAAGDDAHDIAPEIARGPDPAAVITARADELGECVVCMSTRGRGRVAGTVIGSVTRAVLQSSAAPVVAVGPMADRPRALVGRPPRRPARWPEPLSVGRLVAAVADSDAADLLVPVAVRWASALGMTLAITTVAEDVAGPLDDDPPQNAFGPPHPQRFVDELADRWRGAGVEVVGEVVYDPISVASGLRAQLAAEPAGLVAVTTRAHSGIDRLRMGAVAADIVRTSTAPTLVVSMTGV